MRGRQPLTVVSPVADPDSAMARDLFQLQQVSVNVDRKAILHPTSLTLQSGTLYGLIGHNGSGKSTLMKVLARQLSASTGQCRFKGRELDSWSGRAFARQVAMLPQHLPVTDDLKGHELLAMSRFAWQGLLGHQRARDRAAIEHAVALTGTQPLLTADIGSLSGGERQRLWLAMLVAQQTEVLLLDEPTSALDPGHQLEVLTLIRRLAVEQHKCVVVIIHDINMAARFCHQLLALKGGRLIAQGPPAQLMQPEPLQQIFDVAMEVIQRPNRAPLGVLK
ncbi:ABC transporter ATP-binding protein [Ferrimonas kyonanensis]|uniref:ABC transporter ATP-binding protein n=1 Tax=Ferrimonas kyonanensis TaxID=364763 RepID=UPI0003FA8F17|nr:ATP-binding cassette domain-containing protein [Ferrimonas kyonanensis]